jgi:3-phenylpropionate/trans-cinnamate dioxygenase ferredoxin subunit
MQHRLANAAKNKPGSAKPYTVGDIDVLICNVEGSFYAIEDVCTHDGGALDQGMLQGSCVVCPRHGATFDVTTGAALTLPAVMPVATFPLTIDGNDLIVEV